MERIDFEKRRGWSDWLTGHQDNAQYRKEDTRSGDHKAICTAIRGQQVVVQLVEKRSLLARLVIIGID